MQEITLKEPLGPNSNAQAQCIRVWVEETYGSRYPLSYVWFFKLGMSSSLGTTKILQGCDAIFVLPRTLDPDPRV